MEFSEVVRRRRMVRRYQPDRAVPDDVREALLAAARRAPSAGFSQGVSFLVLETPAARDRFWSATASDGPDDPWLSGMKTAPLLILVWTSELAYRKRYTEPNKAAGGTQTDRAEHQWPAPIWYVDAGMAAMAMLYAAVDAEPQLGACFFGLPVDRVDVVREVFGVPGDQLTVGVISVGYRAPDEVPSGSPTQRGRKPVEEVVHRGRW